MGVGQASPEARREPSRRVWTLLIWAALIPVFNLLVPALLQFQFTLETMAFFGEHVTLDEVMSHRWLLQLARACTLCASALVIAGAAYLYGRGRSLNLWIAAGCSLAISLFWMLIR